MKIWRRERKGGSELARASTEDENDDSATGEEGWGLGTKPERPWWLFFF